jgi:hypothetical protein
MGVGPFKAREQGAELASSAEGPVIKPHFAPERFQAQDEEMRARGASNFLTAYQKAIYCSALEEMGYARGAELAAGTSWRTVKEHREMFPDFDAACVEAMEGSATGSTQPPTSGPWRGGTSRCSTRDVSSDPSGAGVTG